MTWRIMQKGGAAGIGRRWIAAGAMTASVALGGCQTMEEVADMLEDATRDAVGGVVGYHMLPTLQAAVEEYCLGTEIIMEQTGLDNNSPFVKEAAVSFMRSVVGDEVPAMYCQLNVIGAAYVTDQALQRMTGEIGRGFLAVYDGLDMKDEDILRTLESVQALEAKGAAVYAGDSATVTIRKLDQISATLQTRIDERMQAGGLSEAAKLKLVQAGQHLRNGSYYRGKALIGAFVIYRELTQTGSQEILVNVLQSSGEGDLMQTLEVIAFGGLELARGTGDSLALTDKVFELADEEEFADALDDLKNPDPHEKGSLVEFAAQEKEQTDDLGLPTLNEKGKAA